MLLLLFQVSVACRYQLEVCPAGTARKLDQELFWWFSGQICTVKARDKLWSCSHTQPCAEPGAVKDSPFVAAHATVQTWLHTEGTGQGAVAGSKRVPTPFPLPSPCPGWCQGWPGAGKAQSPV